MFNSFTSSLINAHKQKFIKKAFTSCFACVSCLIVSLILNGLIELKIAALLDENVLKCRSLILSAADLHCHYCFVALVLFCLNLYWLLSLFLVRHPRT